MPRRSQKAPKAAINIVAVDKDLIKPTQYRHTNLTELPPIYKELKANPDFKPLKLEPIVNPGPKYQKASIQTTQNQYFKGSKITILWLT
jgi:hypothetical protein